MVNIFNGQIKHAGQSVMKVVMIYYKTRNYLSISSLCILRCYLYIIIAMVCTSAITSLKTTRVVTKQNVSIYARLEETFTIVYWYVNELITYFVLKYLNSFNLLLSYCKNLKIPRKTTKFKLINNFICNITNLGIISFFKLYLILNFDLIPTFLI